MAKSTISAGYPKAFIEFAISRGAERKNLLGRSGISALDLEQLDNRVLLDRYLALLEAGTEQCNEPALALLFGEAVKMQDVTIVGMIGETARDIDEARRSINRYARLLLDDNDDAANERVTIIPEKDGVWISLTSSLYIKHRPLVETALAQCASGVRELGPEGTSYLKAIRFTHSEPAYVAEYERIFGVPVFFDSEMNALLLDRAIMSLKLPGTNPYFSGILNAHADALLKSLESSRTCRGRVEATLMCMLHTGRASIATVSRELGVSRHTLFRRLRNEGITYEQVLEELRNKLSKHYLVDERVSVNETAYLLGFSEPAAFSRAYKRWTGTRPSKAR